LSVHRVHQATHSQFTATAVALGAAQSRWVCEGFLNGSNASFSCQLLVQQAMTQQHDAVVHAHHQAPHTKSDVQCRSIADDQAQTASSFKAHVAANAEGAEASQNHQNILLSSAARMHSKPSLEIYTDDVTCAHGATVGALDEAALFFLRSRGLSEAAARSMLLMAFAEHILQQVPDDAWQQNCRERLALWAPQQQLGAVEAASSQEVPQ
jgi:Fe-S cluster assembly protein SufD